MRAALIEAIGRPPILSDVPEPDRGDGHAVVEVTAAPLNPIDVSIATGRFYRPPSELPYVAGKEGVGRVVEGTSLEPGTRVYFTMPGGLGGPGALAERAAPSEEAAYVLPDGIDDALAACLGVAGLAAWLPLEWRGGLRAGETVLVLGASGAVGQIAVQAAKLLGAGRVVAAGRSREGLERALALGADAAVDLGASDDPEALGETVREAAGAGIDLALDPLWGDMAAVAVHAAAEHGRVVHVGQSAGLEARLPSGPVRGKMLSILGHSNGLAPRDVAADAYLRMAQHAAHGRLGVDHEILPLDEVANAWERQEAFPRRKLVLRP